MRRTVQCVLLLHIICLTGCGFATQLTCDLDYRNIGSLTLAMLERDGIGVLTPSIVTGRETDKQIIGEVLSDVLEAWLTAANVVPLAGVLNQINTSGLAETYAASLNVYDASGIIPQAAIGQIGEAVGTRYLAKASLANFEQNQVERFGVAGIRVLTTNRTRIRLFLEVWDSNSGRIVWYANEELAIAADTATEEDLSVRGASIRALNDMMATILADADAPVPEDEAEPICAREEVAGA